MTRRLATFLSLCLAHSIAAEEPLRTWTEEGGERTMEASMMRKDDRKGEVTLRLPDRSNITVKVAKFVQSDQDFVKKWIQGVNPADQLSVKVVASGRGGKTVKVSVKAGKVDVVVMGVDFKKKKFKRHVKAGQSGTFETWAPDDYVIVLRDKKGKLIDRETSLRKT